MKNNQTKDERRTTKDGWLKLPVDLLDQLRITNY